MFADLFDSPWKILIVAVVLIVLFGSKKLPDAARSLGRSMRILKTEVSGLAEDEPGPADEASWAQVPPARLAASAATATPDPADQRSQLDALQQQVRDLQRAAAVNMAPVAVPAEVRQAREAG
jgi:sec-independent protein translocase protein TatA